MKRSLCLRSIWLSVALQLHGVQAQSSGDEVTVDHAVIAHGVLMGVAFALLFPIGASIMHAFEFRGFVWFHAGWQLFAYVVALAGFGLGVWIAVVTEQLSASNGHPIIGIIVIGALLFQSFGGWLAHHLFQQKLRKTVVHYVHRWMGRVFLILGAINGGLGLQLSDNTTKGEIAYGVVAGVSFLTWFALWFFDRNRTQRKQDSGKTSNISLQANVAENI